MLTLIPSTLILGLIGGAAPCARACICVVPRPVELMSVADRVSLARGEAFAILAGTVTRVDTLVLDSLWFPSDTAGHRRRRVYPSIIQYAVVVDSVWKGPRRRNVTITDYAVGSDCSRDYVLGESYLIYAYQDRRQPGPARLTTISCSRVLLKEESAADRQLLGRGRAPDS